MLLIYVDNYINSHPVAGIYRSISMADSYANTPNFEKMKEDQLAKMKKNSGNENKLFLLSWTLTANEKVITEDAKKRLNPFESSSSLHQLTKKASPHLADFIQKYGDQYQINVIYVDFYSESRAPDLAIYLNREKEDLPHSQE